MSRYSDLPYVQARWYGGIRPQTQMIVIHATDNTASDENEASFASHRPDTVSAHFYNDEDSVTQTLDTALVAYGCYPTGNSRSVQFELVGTSNQLSDATLRQAAPIVARACAEFGLPIRKLAPTELRVGMTGICGHADVTAAWGEGNHTDPGPAFPWDKFIGYVQAAAGAGEDDDMPTGLGPVQLPAAPNALESYSIWPVNAGGLPWGPAWLTLFTDLFGGKAAFRIAVTPGDNTWKFLGTPPAAGQEPRVILESGKIFNTALPTGTRGISVMRVPAGPDDKCTGAASMSIEYGKR